MQYIIIGGFYMGKIFKTTLITIIVLLLLGAMWNIPLLGTVMKIVISAALITWLVMTFKNFNN